jgi:hypothetical protein
LGYFFTPFRLCIGYDKNWIALHFGRFFHKQSGHAECVEDAEAHLRM